MIRNEVNERHKDRTEMMKEWQKDHDDFVEFRAEMRADMRLMQRRRERQTEVGVVNALATLGDELNPWSPTELEIKRRMQRNPTFQGISDDDIILVIQRLDEEVRSGLLKGDKLMAAHYLLRTLNGELEERYERNALMRQAG